MMLKKRIVMLLLFCALLCNVACASKTPRTITNVNIWHNYFGGGSMQNRMESLIDEYNRSTGRQQGIAINVSLIGTSSDLVKNFDTILNQEAGAAELPDIAIIYPRTAKALRDRGLLVELDPFFSVEELAAFKPDFLLEGEIDGRLCVLPANKSTEVLFLNQSIFDEIAPFLEVTTDDLLTIESLFKTAKNYYAWTDALTPDVSNDGRDFLAIDAWFNFFQIYMSQHGTKLLTDDGNLNVQSPHFLSLWNLFADATLKGGMSLYDGYASEISRTGEILCSIGSTAGIHYYGQEVTAEDGRTRQVNYRIYPFPVSEGQSPIAIQRGGGLVVLKSDQKTEAAAVSFLKWFTETERNYKFTLDSGYMPVKAKAFDDYVDNPHQLEEGQGSEAILSMQKTLVYMSRHYQMDFNPLNDRVHSLNERFDEVFKSRLTLAKSDAANLMVDSDAYNRLKEAVLDDILHELTP